MTTYIIDYKTETGRNDFQCVHADTAEQAEQIFRSAGISWRGTNFATVEITAITER